MATSGALSSKRARLLVACTVIASSLGAVGTCAAYHVAVALASGVVDEHGRVGVPMPGQTTSAGRTPPIKVADADDPWTQALRSGAFWSRKGSGTDAERRSETQKIPRSQEPRRKRHRETRATARHETTAGPYAASIPKEWRASSRSSSTYRTVCVRLCDGFYWPVSFATNGGKLGADSEACEESCRSPAALYYYPNPGGEPEDMVNLQGEPYTRLSKAFLYRTTYDANCKCRAHPWEQEAVDRHMQYAKGAHVDAAAELARQ